VVLGWKNALLGFFFSSNVRTILSAPKISTINLFSQATFWLQVIRFIKPALFARGSRRVIYWSRLFTTAGDRRGRREERVLVTKIMRWIAPFLSFFNRAPVGAPFFGGPSNTPLINFNKSTTVSKTNLSFRMGRKCFIAEILGMIQGWSTREVNGFRKGRGRVCEDVLP